MAPIDPDIQAQCLDLLRGIKSADEKQNDLLGRLVSLMAGPTVEPEPVKKVKETSSNSMCNSNVAAQKSEAKSNDEESDSDSNIEASAITVAKQDPCLARIRQFMPDSYTKRLCLFSIPDDALPIPTIDTTSTGSLLDVGGENVPLQSNFSPRIPEDRKSIACLVDSWKYWYPTNRDTKTQTSTGISPVPDFMPWWQFTRGPGQSWYHIDDRSHEHPIPWRETSQGSNLNDVDSYTDVAKYGVSHRIGRSSFRLSGTTHYVVEVPYSFLPGVRFIFRELFRREDRYIKDHDLPKSGLNKSERENIRQSLGDLYARAADDDTDQCLKTCLEHTQSLLNELFQFVIVDIAARGGTQNAVYKRCRGALSLQSEGPTYWTMVQPALQKEGFGLVAQPSFISCRRFDPLYEEGRWCRVIKLDGLAIAVAGKIQGDITNANAKDVWGLLFNTNSNPTSKALLEIMDRHLFCRPSARGLRTLNNEVFKGFHLSWNQLRPKAFNETEPKSTWGSGRLYGSRDRFIEQRAFTIAYFASHSVEKTNLVGTEDTPKCFWTLLVLDWPFSSSRYHQFQPIEGLEYRAEDFMFATIRDSLTKAAKAWDGVRAALGSIIDPEPQFLDPEEHGNPLFDDDTFSRSREYFLIVSCLESFQAHINDTIEEWESFHKDWPDMRMSINLHTFKHDQSPEELKEEVLENINAQVDRLKDISASFKSSSERTKALREGLFSVSGVIEIRVSTRLGENIKLLTYVSIFYPPLSFCVALWSTNENYGRPMLVVTSVLVAAATFIVVANLRNMTSICSKAYHGVKKPIVRRMHDSHDDDWMQKGKGFDSYRPLRQEVVPSEWYIPYFLLAKKKSKHK
ncbi:hypothetical protein NW762_006283 [Fusarium torreyae]|uniref:Uncharacterized protein n=1 Tax=Fusarium torreyae TaxID=1237075 RepID=A0A9W8VHU9_9HYPO|nr:hypothetical protein NW762_006283 [Fusarium torreyae]